MYSYYLLAALLPQYQQYLWWKKYITTLQMVMKRTNRARAAGEISFPKAERTDFLAVTVLEIFTHALRWRFADS